MSKTLKAHLTGEATLYRSDKWGYPVYSIKLSSLNKDGIWEYDYIQAQLPFGQELDNNTEIKINDGFITFFSRKNGVKEKCIKILSYDVVNKLAGDIDIPVNVEEIEDTELPF